MLICFFIMRYVGMFGVMKYEKNIYLYFGFFYLYLDNFLILIYIVLIFNFIIIFI